jgi:pimeloyl-ACP methyl ester carboxylesterase
MTENGGDSIYRSPQAASALFNRYDAILDRWPADRSALDIPTSYGTVRVNITGPETGEPAMLFHAASMASVSWAPNVAALVEAGFRVFAADYIGEAGRSELTDLGVYPRTPSEIGGLGGEIADQLGIDQSVAIGASAGGHAALRYAQTDPGRVSRLVLLGPMGITPLGLPGVMRMMTVSMFPSESRIARTQRWAIGSSPAVSDPYGEWFAEVLRAVAAPPRVGRPKPLTTDEMAALGVPILLILGDGDNLVGDPGRAARRAAAFPDIEVDVVPSAHLVNVEQAKRVNERMVEFLTMEG